jgi:hypothetical protein
MRCVQNEFYDTNPLDNLNPSFDSSSCGSFECSKFENTYFNSGCKNNISSWLQSHLLGFILGILAKIRSSGVLGNDN